MEDIKIVIRVMECQGITDHKLYVDISGTMYTMIHQYEVYSLDQYFAFERGIFENPDADTRVILGHYNCTTNAGRREIYEVII